MSYTREVWVKAVLEGIGNASPSQSTVDWGVAWSQVETTAPPGASFNLWNTTEKWKPDGTPYPATEFNSVGVKNYASFADGIEANAKVLRNKRYPHLLAALQTDATLLSQPSDAIQAELITWGTAHAGDTTSAKIAKLASEPAQLRGSEAFPGDGPTPQPMTNTTAPPAPVPPVAVKAASPPGPTAQVAKLTNFPMVSERTSVTGDSHPSENAGLDCVAASILAGAMYLLGKTQLDATFNPDHFKDAVYGQGYVGGMSASAYVPYLKTLGVNLTSYKANDTMQLVAEAHSQVAAKHPVVFTEPNPYGNPNYTHVCVFFEEGPGTLTSMDPWIAQAITHADAVWERTLLDNEIWILSLIEEAMMLITDPLITANFTVVNGNELLYKGMRMGSGITSWYLKHGGPAVLRFPVSGEIAVKNDTGNPIPDLVYLVLQTGIAFYDPHRHGGPNPYTNEACYLLPLDSGPGQNIITKPVVAALQTQLAEANAKLATVPNDSLLVTLQQEVSAYQATQEKIKALLAA